MWHYYVIYMFWIIRPMRYQIALFMLAMMALPLLLKGQNQIVRDDRAEAANPAVCLSNLHGMEVCDAAVPVPQSSQQRMVLVRGQLLPLQPAKP
jgi:hypothetical protein